jgi:hypothetical protein
MASREAINRVKIELARLSRVPVDQTETIYQGDLIVWDVANKRATKAVAASGSTFMGMSETTNPIETAGSSTFLTDLQSPRINVIQKGLVEVIAGENVTLYPWDLVKIGADAQKVLKTGATETNFVAVVDPNFAGTSGKAVVTGDLVKVWLRPRPLYSASADATETAVA